MCIVVSYYGSNAVEAHCYVGSIEVNETLEQWK